MPTNVDYQDEPDGRGLASVSFWEGGLRDIPVPPTGALPLVSTLHTMKVFDGPFLNDSGTDITIGMVCRINLSGADPRTSIVVNATADSTLYAGVAVETIANGSCGRLQVEGICERVNMPNATVAGARLQPAATSGAMEASGAFPEPIAAYCVVAPAGALTYGVARLKRWVG